MSDVVVVIGAGQIGQAIARRISAGKHVVLADLRQGNADAAAEVLASAGFDVSTATVDVSSRQSVHALAETAAALGDVTGVIHAAGVSPSQASAETILAVDLYGTALVLEEFGNVIAHGGTGVVISSQSGHRLAALTAEQDAALATTPADDLLNLPMLQPGQVTDTLHAYQLAKRGNSLRVRAEAVRWAKRGARVNTISPGIIITPLARHELTGPRGEGYRRMIDLSPDRLLLLRRTRPNLTGDTAWNNGPSNRPAKARPNGSPEMSGSTRSPEGSRPPSSASRRCISPQEPAPPGIPTTEAKPSTSPKATAWSNPAAGRPPRSGQATSSTPPDGEEHWHGATPEHFMTHLSVTEGPPHWGAQVTDAEYQPPCYAEADPGPRFKQPRATAS